MWLMRASNTWHAEYVTINYMRKHRTHHQLTQWSWVKCWHPSPFSLKWCMFVMSAFQRCKILCQTHWRSQKPPRLLCWLTVCFYSNRTTVEGRRMKIPFQNPCLDCRQCPTSAKSRPLKTTLTPIIKTDVSYSNKLFNQCCTVFLLFTNACC